MVAAPPLTIVERLGNKLQVGWLALLTAAGLGIAHALAPGHGKTLMAAFLVGRRGKVRHAAGLGLAVAMSHTLGVGILGIVTVFTTSRFEPERIYPWLSIASAPGRHGHRGGDAHIERWYCDRGITRTGTRKQMAINTPTSIMKAGNIATNTTGPRATTTTTATTTATPTGDEE